MTDVHDKATRSKNMRAIGTRNTAIEKRLAGLLTQAGFDFRVQDPALAGRPDFVIDAWQCIIFTHGCFWHHHDCYLFKVPATRTDFWLDKIGKNVERDRRDLTALIAQGWRVLIVWECALRGRLKLNDTDLTERLEEWICGGGQSARAGGGRALHIGVQPALTVRIQHAINRHDPVKPFQPPAGENITIGHEDHVRRQGRRRH